MPARFGHVNLIARDWRALADPASADKLGPTPERAALVLVANTLLNLDLALVR